MGDVRYIDKTAISKLEPPSKYVMWLQPEGSNPEDAIKAQIYVDGDWKLVGGTVGSVNGKTGEVVLDSTDVGAQAALVSGENIKTINNESILGSGNITIQGGGGAVGSVNGKTGAVVLDAEDVGALPDDTIIPEALDTVNVSVNNSVGTPSGSASISGSTISFSFSNLKGAQGEKGDTVILGEEEEYTLYNVTGQNTDGAMTQKSVTDLMLSKEYFNSLIVVTKTETKII